MRSVVLRSVAVFVLFLSTCGQSPLKGVSVGGSLTEDNNSPNNGNNSSGAGGHIIAVTNNEPAAIYVWIDAGNAGTVAIGKRHEFCCFDNGTFTPSVSGLGFMLPTPGPAVTFTDAAKTAEYTVTYNAFTASGAIACSNCQ